MDLTSITLAGLIAIGAVNFLTMFKPDIDSRAKFILSLAVAFGVGFIPTEFGNMLLTHIKDAVEIAFTASGIYKIGQKVGGK